MSDRNTIPAPSAQPFPQKFELLNEAQCSARLSGFGIRRSVRTLQRARAGLADAPQHTTIGGRHWYRADHIASWAHKVLTGGNYQ